MNTFTITVKSKDRISGNSTDFNIKFGHVFPNDKRVFKCKISAITLNLNAASEVRNTQAVPAVALSFSLTADFPFINNYSTSSNFPSISLISSTLMLQTMNSHEFLISNINHQTINFKVVDLHDNLIDHTTFNESIFLITAEAIE